MGYTDTHDVFDDERHTKNRYRVGICYHNADLGYLGRLRLTDSYDREAEGIGLDNLLQQTHCSHDVWD